MIIMNNVNNTTNINKDMKLIYSNLKYTTQVQNIDLTFLKYFKIYRQYMAQDQNYKLTCVCILNFIVVIAHENI